MMDDLQRRSFGFDASNIEETGSTRFMPCKRSNKRISKSKQPSTLPSEEHGGFYTDPAMPFAVALDSPQKEEPDRVELEEEIAALKAALKKKNHEIASLKSECSKIPKLQQQVYHYKKKVEGLKAAVGAASPGPAGSTTTQGLDTPKKTQPVTISPNIFSVTKNRGVQRLKLARCASMGTKRSLMEAEMSLAAPASDGIAERVIQRVENYEAHKSYFSSMDFASDLSRLCSKTARVFNDEPRVLKVPSPCYIFGDLHGNIQDLQFFREKIWTLGVELTAGNFLCLGDYVDRGNNSLEVVAYMFALKCVCPNKMFLLRGNHELRSVNGQEGHYGKGSFLAQCKDRFGLDIGEQIWTCVNQAFDYLPLAAVVDDSMFCVHGGIPRRAGEAQLTNPKYSNMLNVVNELPKRMGVMPNYPHENQNMINLAMDLLWGDPARAEQESRLDAFGFGPSQRGGSISNFGTKAIDDFLQRSGLSYIIRAHEATASGIRISKGAKVFTVFSTSKNHNCGADATCGCILVDDHTIHAINRAIEKDSPRRSALAAPAPAVEEHTSAVKLKRSDAL